MKTLDIIRRISGTLAAMVMLAGCGEPTAQPTSIDSVAQTGAMAIQRHRVRSWMAPDVRKNDLIYTANADGVYILSLHDGHLVGQLDQSANGTGLCSDQDGDVFIPSAASPSNNTIVEYAHGGTQPTATIIDKYGAPFGCAVDSNTGALAVANSGTPSSPGKGPGPGNVVVYTTASHTGEMYSYPGFTTYFFCTYDPQGNLFVDGDNGILELPKDSKTFTLLSVDKIIRQPTALQWDGKYITLEDANESAIYRLRMSGSTATTVQTIHLRRWNDPHGKPQSWIQDKRVAAPGGRGDVVVRLWRYPGGKLLWKSKVSRLELVGTTISVARGKRS